ncbi:MAG: hypothetical protein QOE05_924 [Actinomycetota bacterium]|jgi:hypothetical protein|nr:hypothetical protein [Actinomycetota bacterium]
MRRVAAVVGMVLFASGCSTPATPTALSSDFSDVFAGLYLGQHSLLGPTSLTRDSLKAHSVCRRSGAAKQGPGEDWICVVQYDDGDSSVSQSFEVQMKPDGCWRAEGPPTAQPPMLTDPATGRLWVNQLAEFDGCLDTSWG